MEDCLEFKTRYEKLSGLDLPIEYLQTSDIYIFRKGKEMVGGFVLGSNSPMRTTEIFISKSKQAEFLQNLNSNKICEVCCFWIARKYRKNKFVSAKFWFNMAYAIKRQTKDHILYGTNSKGYAKLYAHPRNSIFIHTDCISGKETYIFITKRKHFYGGVWEIVISKILNRKRAFDSKPLVNLQNIIA